MSMVEKFKESKAVLKEILIHDYILTNKKIPYFLEPEIIERNMKHELLKDEEILNILHEKYKDISTQKLVKNIIIVKFENNITNFHKKKEKGYIIVLYDIINNKNYDITNKYKELIWII